MWIDIEGYIPFSFIMGRNELQYFDTNNTEYNLK